MVVCFTDAVLYELLSVDPVLLSCSFVAVVVVVVVVVVLVVTELTYLSFFLYYVAYHCAFLRHIPSSLVAERMSEFKDHDAVVVQVT